MYALFILVLVSNLVTVPIFAGNFSYDELSDHTIVTDNGVFPYVVAILKKSSFISTGTLIDKNWVLTAADSLYLLRESVREVRIRLGSTNYKKGGTVLPIKFFDIHPYYNHTSPEYDIALIRLATPAQASSVITPIRLLKHHKRISAAHFVVNAWANPKYRDKTGEELQQLVSMEVIQRRRYLTMARLHPSDRELCADERDALNITNDDTIMCLEVALGTKPCVRDAGAPVVLNDVLWAVVSSYTPENCQRNGLDTSPSFATMVTGRDIKPWIHATIKGHKWIDQQFRIFALPSSKEDDSLNDDDDEDRSSKDDYDI